MRCFLALALPADVRRRAAAVQQAIAGAAAGAAVRWVAEESLHVTLKFLGEVDGTRLPAIADALSAETARHRLDDLVVEGAGAFPPRGRPHTLWLGVRDAAGALGPLVTALEGVLAPLGFPPEGRPFTGHVTIGRVRARERATGLRRALEAAGAAPAGRFRPRAVTLFESVPGAGGPRYQARAECPLAP